MAYTYSFIFKKRRHSWVNICRDFLYYALYLCSMLSSVGTSKPVMHSHTDGGNLLCSHSCPGTASLQRLLYNWALCPTTAGKFGGLSFSTPIQRWIREGLKRQPTDYRTNSSFLIACLLFCCYAPCRLSLSFPTFVEAEVVHLTGSTLLFIK